MTDLAVIILTKDERLHIQRCLERLAPLEPRQVFIVDSLSNDGTQEIVEEFANGSVGGWKDDITHKHAKTQTQQLVLVEHPWPGLQSLQFNWALDNLPIETKWVLRLDADEYLADASINWLKNNIESIDDRVGALEFTLERKFLGREIRHGTNGISMIRMFRMGRGRYAETLMDERIVFKGERQTPPVVFYDDNLNSLGWWREKHRGYALREARQALENSSQDPRKAKYYKLPPYFRAFLYFCFFSCLETLICATLKLS